MWRRFFLVLYSVTLISCATITTGTRENIVISSSPSAANATLVCNGRPAGSGLTPVTIAIRRNGGDCDLRLAKDGFEQATVSIEQGVNPAYWTNMAFTPLAPGGTYLLVAGNSGEKLIGVAALGTGFVLLATDFWTGAVHAHRPSKIDIVLKPKQ